MTIVLYTCIFFFFFEIYMPNQPKAMRRPRTFDGTFIGSGRPPKNNYLRANCIRPGPNTTVKRESMK